MPRETVMVWLKNGQSQIGENHPSESSGEKHLSTRSSLKELVEGGVAAGSAPFALS